MKGCNKCQKWRDESEFHRDKNKKDGLQSNCIKCKKKQGEKNKENKKQKDKERYENNKEELLKKGEEYRKNNPEKIRQYQQEYYQNNKKGINQRNTDWYHSPLDFNSSSQMRKEIELYEEIKQSVNGNVEIKCAKCKKGFEPKNIQICRRLDAINGKESKGAEERLYCSDECKEICPIYNQESYPKGHKPDLDREVQPELAEMVLERDEYICIICQRHQNEIEVQCHHIEGIRGNPLESADMDICTTLCIDCHKEVHKQEDCTYKDMQCPPDLKYKY